MAAASSDSLLIRPAGPAPPAPPAEVGRILQRVSGFITITAVGHLSELGVFDTMATKQAPMTAAEIAKLNGNSLHPEMLQRALRTISVDGWVTENERFEFQLADARFLVSGKQSLKNLFEVMSVCPSHQLFKANYGDVLKTNKDVARQSLGDDFWTWFDKHPRERHRFASTMTDMTSQTAPAVASHFGFSRFSTVVDLGGSQGVLCHAIKIAHPAIRAISFDLPALTEEVKKNTLEGIEYVGGSFFDSVPEADVYTASHILHDWSDEKCIEILACVKKSIRPNGRLILIEGIMPEAGQPFKAPFLGSIDLLMGALLSAKERTLSEWQRLLEQGGFYFVAVSDSLGSVHLIEAAPK